MMHIRLFMVLLFTLYSVNLIAQEGEAIVYPKYSVYTEVLGNNLLYSLNFDARFSNTPQSFGARVGAGVLPSRLFYTFQGNYLVGRKKLKLEVGLGVTAYEGLGTDKGEREAAVSAAVQLRYHSSKRIMFRAGWSPVFIPADENNAYSDIGKIFWFWPGAAIGYSF